MSTVAARTATQPQRRPAPQRQPSLQVVQERRRRVRRRRIAPILAGVLVTASLFVVVIGHAELTQGQVRLSAIEQAVTAAETAHRQEVLSVATLENPSRILQVAEQTLHMTPPSAEQQVPHVSLGTAVPTPTLSTTQGTPTGSAVGGK